MAGSRLEDRLYFASDYFDQMYEAAVKLIKKGKAYVCDLSPGRNPGIQRNPDGTRKGEPVPQQKRGGESGAV